MATPTVFYNAFVSINSIDHSADFKSVSLPMSIAELDASAMSDDTVINEPGLKSFSFELEAIDDLTDNLLDELMWAMWDTRAKNAIIFRPDAGVKSATNPEYTFSAFIKDLGILGGGHGEILGGSLGFSNTTVLARGV